MAYDNQIAAKYPNIIRVVITLTQDGALYLCPEHVPISDSGFPTVGSFPVTSVFWLACSSLDPAAIYSNESYYVKIPIALLPIHGGGTVEHSGNSVSFLLCNFFTYLSKQCGERHATV